MKRYSSCFILMAFSFSLFGQIQKGSWMIGGSVNFENSHADNLQFDQTQLTTNVLVSPEIGFFISNNVLVGLEGQFSNSTAATLGSNFEFETRRTIYTLHPFFQVFMNKGRFRSYSKLKGGISENRVLSQDISGEFEQKWTNYSLFGGIGVNYFMLENLAVDLLLNYEFLRKGDGEEFFVANDETLSVDVGIKLFINKNQRFKNKIQPLYLKKGNYVFGLNLNGNTKLSRTPFQLSGGTSFRYFQTNKLEIGSSLNFFFSDFKNDDFGSHSFGVRGQARYFFQIRERMFFAPMAQLGYTNTTHTHWGFTISGKATTLTNSFSFLFNPSMYYFFKSKNIFKIGLNLSNNRSYQHATNLPSKTIQDVFTFGWTMGIEHFVQENISIQWTGSWNLLNGHFGLKEGNSPEPIRYAQGSYLKVGLNYFLRSIKKKEKE